MSKKRINTKRITISHSQTGVVGDYAHIEGGIHFHDKPNGDTTRRYVPPPFSDPSILPVPGTLPPGYRMPLERNELFTGRTVVLKHLAKALLSNDTSSIPVPFVISGMPGVGKTQLAAEFVHRYGRFFHGVHWLDASHTEELESEVVDCGRRMNLSSWPAQQPDQVARTIREWEQGNQRLVVFDNLNSFVPARQWLARLKCEQIRILITSQHSDWPNDIKLRKVHLEVFTSSESQKFLSQHLKESQGTKDDFHKLAERLGHLPLALELARRYLVHLYPLKVADYLEDLTRVGEHPSMQKWRAERGSPTKHDLHLLDTFALSWEQVTNEVVRKIFAMCGYCAPTKPIPVEVLERTSSCESSEPSDYPPPSDLSKDFKWHQRILLRVKGHLRRFVFLRRKPPATLPQYKPIYSTDHCYEALDLLSGLGLLQEIEDKKAYRIHLLLSEFAQAQEGASEVLPALTRALAELAHQANKTGKPNRFAPLYPHAKTVALAAEKAKIKEAATLWDNVGYYLNMLADYEEAEDACSHALATAKRVHSERHPQVADCLTTLGWGLQMQGRLSEALDCFEQALKIDRAIFVSSHHLHIARDLRNIGNIYKAQGNLDKARECIVEAVNASRNGPPSQFAQDVHSMGWLFKDQGNLSEARLCFEKALNAAKDNLGVRHPDVATYAISIASVFMQSKEPQKALKYINEALQIDREVFGPAHHTVARDLVNLGWAYKDIGDLDTAWRYIERAVNINQSRFGPDEPELVDSLLALGWVLKDRGDLEGALSCFNRALEINRATYGPEHFLVSKSLNTVGMILDDLGRLAEAISAFEKALSVLDILAPDIGLRREIQDHLHILQSKRVSGCPPSKQDLQESSDNASTERKARRPGGPGHYLRSLDWEYLPPDDVLSARRGCPPALPPRHRL